MTMWGNGDTTLNYYCTIVGFAIVSILVWKFLLSPSKNDDNAAAAASTRTLSSTGVGANNGNGSTARRRSGSNNRTTLSATANKDSGEDDDDAFSFGQPRHPSHYFMPTSTASTTAALDFSKCLLQGIVPFRSTHASGYETRLQQKQQTEEVASKDLIVVNRKERARIFARMFSSPSSSIASKKKSDGSAASAAARPPNRGANIVLTIASTDVCCDKLQKSLYLLGTYYNLFVLIDGSLSGNSNSNSNISNDDDKMVRTYINKLRDELLNEGGLKGSTAEGQYKLNKEILPRHRIIFASTTKGRVAFVRQLHGTELVVDYDVDVTKELERFGFRVLNYPVPKSEGGEGRGVASALGTFLIP